MFKKIAFCFAGLVIIWAVVGLIRIRVFSQRAGVIIDSTEPFQQVGTSGQKILVLGDSLAYGTGTSSPENSVAGLVASRYPGATVVNMSANGKRTADLAKEVKNIQGEFDLILVIIGGNDVLRPWLSLLDARKNLETIYSEAAKHSSNVVALTTGNLRYTTFFLPPLNYYFGQRSTTLRNYALETALKTPNVTYINLVERNKTVPFDHLKESPDHLHLSDDGANYWFEAIVASGALN